MSKKSFTEYCTEHKIEVSRVGRRLVHTMKCINTYISYMGIIDSVKVNGRMVKQSIVDYFVDVARIKELHDITKTNKQKVYSYTAYWLLKRKPIQVVNNFEDCEYINELFVTAFLTSLMTNAKRIDKKKRLGHPSCKTFQDLLFYNLKYRPISPQSLELMIEAFFCGCDVMKNVPGKGRPRKPK